MTHIWFHKGALPSPTLSVQYLGSTFRSKVKCSTFLRACKALRFDT